MIFGVCAGGWKSELAGDDIHVKDLTGTIKAVWFRMPFLKKTLAGGGQVTLRGRAVNRRDGLVLEHPEIFYPSEKYEEKLHKEHEKADKKNAKREAKLAARAEKQAVRDAKKNAKKKKSRPVAAPSGQRPAGKVVSGTKGSGTGKKTPDSARDKRITAQQSIPYHEMGRDGICRVQDKFYSKTIRFL